VVALLEEEVKGQQHREEQQGLVVAREPDHDDVQGADGVEKGGVA